MKRKITLRIVLALIICFLVGTVGAQRRSVRMRKRAKPPQFSEMKLRRTFFDNIFSDGLVGERPPDLNVNRSLENERGPSPGSGGGTESTGGVYAWQEIISSDALEDEIKARKMSVDQNITTPNRFAGGGYRKIRNDFSMLALAFGIVAEYDGDVRWKENAPGIRDAFARSAANSKVGSQQSFNEAKLRQQDLQDLLSGGSVTTMGESERKATWDTVVDRVPLMARLEVAVQENLQPAIANENDFKSKRDEIVHEANIVAAIGEVLVQEGMEESEEEEYTVHARQMKDAARDILAAVDLGNYDGAVAAVGTMTKSCANCHSDWR